MDSRWTVGGQTLSGLSRDIRLNVLESPDLKLGVALGHVPATPIHLVGVSIAFSVLNTSFLAF